MPPLRERLPPLPEHPNRALQTRDVLVAHLLAFFNPALRSLRTLGDFSRTRRAERYPAVDRLPKSTSADFHRLAVLDPVVGHLLAETARRGRHPGAPAPFVMRTRAPGPRGPRFDRRAGVTSDHVGRPAGSQHREAPGAVPREVVIAVPGEPGGVVRLLTDPTGVAARVVGRLSRHRRRAGLLLRRLKAAAHSRHLPSRRREATAFEVHVAVTGTSPWAPRDDARPSKDAFAVLHRVAGGGATAEETFPIPAGRERRCAPDREGRRRRQAKRPEARGA